MANDVIKRTYFMRAVDQLSLEYGTTPEAFTTDGFTLTFPIRPDGIRVYSPHMPFFSMATTGNSVVAMADEQLHDFLQQLAKNAGDPHRLFEYPNLRKIDEKLHEHGRTMLGTVQFYLPGAIEIIPVPEQYSLIWFEDEGAIHSLYPNERFPMALNSQYNPTRPDVIALAAYDGEKIAAMAGASADTPTMWQVGIDVMPEYRSQGLGSSLVSMLSQRIVSIGKLPFYGTAVANVYSQSIAVKCGFVPAWVETVVREL